MSLFTKSVSFLAVLAVAPAAFAVTARPSVIGAAASRMPTMTALIASGGGASSGTTGTTTTTSTLLANAECIDAYTACMKGGDACGSDFEECTTKVLFHGKMPQCLSTLAQCSTAGVSSLFGTGTVSALSAVASKNSYGEVTDYTYPTDGSVLGQMIIGAAISNKYDTSTCVKRYTSCLKKDTVCGNDFELCTTDKEFRKQRVFCDSTLARCQSAGLTELFGSTNTNTAPSATSRIGEMIAEGAALAAVNAVSTCYKVADQCILNACAENPYKCFENSTNATVSLVESINSGTATAESAAATNAITGMDTVSKSNIAAYIKNSCLDTIGSNKYCYATFLGNGQMPTASQLRDEDNQEEIYDEAYSARMNAAMRAKISDLVDKFDTKAKQKCTETIKSCVMRVCGSGSGAACYAQVFGGKDKTINAAASYAELQTGCAAVVNTDAYCKYAAANPNATGGYTYSYINNDAFTTLFPMYEDSATADPIGVVSALNATLANSYSDAAIANMKRQCQSVATSCVKSMCGADYQNCYRNRTDVYSNLTNTGNASFDKSMNKVGGVLDYTIVLGLCLDTVKNASVCEEHLAIERNKLKISNNNATSSWGGANTTRDGWIDAGSATAITATTEQVAATDENGNALCTTKGGSDQGTCYTVDAAGNIYDQPVYISYTTYIESQAASTLFKDLIFDIEKEAQAKYNAKLTKQQNMCMSSNAGGVMGNRENGSTFLWAKLKSNKVPKNYAVSGLTTKDFVASNDIYGSFCRVRITLQSDNKKIQDVIAKGADWSTAYFAAGDAFTCGSWIPESALTALADSVAGDARADAAKGYKRTKGWMTALGTIAGGGLGAWGGSKIGTSNFLGGLTGQSSVKDNSANAETCVKAGDNYSTTKDQAYLTRMLNAARKIDASKDENSELGIAIKGLRDAMMKLPETEKEYKEGYVEKPSKCGKDYLSEIVTVYYADCSVGTGKPGVCGNSENKEFLIGENNSDKNKNISNKQLYKCYKNTTKGVANVTTKVAALQDACQEYTNNKSGQKTKSIATAVGAGVGAVAGGVLAWQATKSVQDAKLDKVEQAAYDEWMNDVGNHIRCFVGSDEVGMYGDIISTSME